MLEESKFLQDQLLESSPEYCMLILQVVVWQNHHGSEGLGALQPGPGSAPAHGSAAKPKPPRAEQKRIAGFCCCRAPCFNRCPSQGWGGRASDASDRAAGDVETNGVEGFSDSEAKHSFIRWQGVLIAD